MNEMERVSPGIYRRQPQGMSAGPQAPGAAPFAGSMPGGTRPLNAGTYGGIAQTLAGMAGARPLNSAPPQLQGKPMVPMAQGMQGMSPGILSGIFK